MTFDKQIFYFAKLSEYAESQEKSRQLIEEQRLLKTHLERLGFEVVLSGGVRGQMERDRAGNGHTQGLALPKSGLRSAGLVG